MVHQTEFGYLLVHRAVVLNVAGRVWLRKVYRYKRRDFSYCRLVPLHHGRRIDTDVDSSRGRIALQCTHDAVRIRIGIGIEIAHVSTSAIVRNVRVE